PSVFVSKRTRTLSPFWKTVVGSVRTALPLESRLNKVSPSPIRCLLTAVGFLAVLPEGGGVFVTVPVDDVEPLGFFGSLAVEGFCFGLRRLVRGAVLLVAGLSFVRDTRNAPRTSS